MSCRILAVVCCALLLCAGCRRQGAAVQVSYKADYPIDTAVGLETFPVEGLWQPKMGVRIGDRIIAHGAYKEKGIYTYPGFRLLRKTAYPREVITLEDDSLLHMWNGREADVYTLRDDSLHKVSSFTVTPTPGPLYAALVLAPGVYIYGDSRDYPGLNEFHITDTNRGEYVAGGSYPEGPTRFKRVRDFKWSYGHGILVKPDKSAFAIVYNCLRRVRIYDRKGILQHDVFLEGSSGNYKIVPTRMAEVYHHFPHAVRTDRYIYLLATDQPAMARPAPRCSILVLDWEGNTVARYRLNALVYWFFVDEERNLLCGNCFDHGYRFFTMDLLH